MTQIPDYQDEADPLADRNLVRISLREIMLFQGFIAVTLWLDVVILGTPMFCMFFPLVIATWAAYRLRNFPLITIVNPFTIALVCNYLMFAIMYTVMYLAAQLQAVFSETTRQNLIRMVGNNDTEETLMMLIIVVPALSAIEGFLALFLATGLENLIGRRSRK